MAEITLKTNGGPHPPEKWAILTSDMIVGIVSVDELSISPEASAARKAKRRLAVDMADLLEDSFSSIADAERNGVESGAVEARHSPFDVEQAVDSALASVSALASKTPLSEIFASDEVKVLVRNILKQNLIDAANVARSWAFDAKGL